MKIVAFDLEGPLSPQDNAYEVMGLIRQGKKLFEVISRYDDLLALEGREGYEPGDTLRLIVPFLVQHGITSQDVGRVSARAGLVEGAKELVADLRAKGWQAYIVSTSYEQHALSIGKRLSIEEANIFCTSLPLDKVRRELKPAEASLLEECSDYILGNLYAEDLACGSRDSAIKPYLDRFYWELLPVTELGQLLQEVRVVGGRRKLQALERIARREGCLLEDMAFVGDSITDAKAAQGMEAAGGLAIAFNANDFLLPYGTVAMASKSLYHLEPILAAWAEGGRAEAKALVETSLGPEGADGPYYRWLAGRSCEEMVEISAIHRRLRRLVREEAGKLG